MHTQNELNSIYRIHTPLPHLNTESGLICGLTEGEAKYIYHHLRTGCILTVKPEWKSKGRCLYAVYYGTHRLGRLNTAMSGNIQKLESSGKVCRLTIGAIIREKYLPPSAIEVELQWGKDRELAC
jgi:hypothetical protein